MIPRDTRPTLEDCETAALIATGKLRFHRDRRVGARGSAAPQAQRQSSRGLWAAPLLAEGER